MGGLDLVSVDMININYATFEFGMVTDVEFIDCTMDGATFTQPPLEISFIHCTGPAIFVAGASDVSILNERSQLIRHYESLGEGATIDTETGALIDDGS